jgi:hypothetical protein
MIADSLKFLSTRESRLASKDPNGPLTSRVLSLAAEPVAALSRTSLDRAARALAPFLAKEEKWELSAIRIVPNNYLQIQQAVSREPVGQQRSQRSTHLESIVFGC